MPVSEFKKNWIHIHIYVEISSYVFFSKMDQSSFNSSSSSSHTFSNSSSFRFKRRNPFGEDRGDDNHVNKTRNQSRMSVFGTIESRLFLVISLHIYILMYFCLSLSTRNMKNKTFASKYRVHDESDDAIFVRCIFNTTTISIFDCDMSFVQNLQCSRSSLCALWKGVLRVLCSAMRRLRGNILHILPHDKVRLSLSLSSHSCINNEKQCLSQL